MAVLPVVLVHGIRLSGACWSAVVEQLTPERRVTTVDLPGHGTRRGERFTLPAAVDAVHDAVDRVGGRAMVVGHSLGGYVSIAAASAAPGLVSGLVVAGASCAPGRALATPFTVMRRVLSTRPDGGDRISGRVFDAVLPRRVAQDVKRGGIATEVIPDVLGAIEEFDLFGNLGDYPGPVWFVNGSRDHFRIHERRSAAACAQARVLIVPRAGHYLPLAKPAVFAQLILDIAAACEARGTRGRSTRPPVRHARNREGIPPPQW